MVSVWCGFDCGSFLIFVEQECDRSCYYLIGLCLFSVIYRQCCAVGIYCYLTLTLTHTLTVLLYIGLEFVL
jgi:hypothetical protein